MVLYVFFRRMATKKAKPNGHYYSKPQDVAEFLAEQDVDDLPGVRIILLHDVVTPQR